MSIRFRPALAALMLLALPSVTFAQSAPAAAPSAPAVAPSGTDAGPRPLAACRADVDKLCPNAKGPERRACMRDNAAKLSPECSAALADIQAKAKAMREACGADVQSLCAEAAKAQKGEAQGKGAGPIVQCLRANEAKLSAGCATAFKARYPKG
jgi:hypothetical protein